MKHTILMIFLMVGIALFAQEAPPQGISYQAVALDEKGTQISGVDIKGNPLPGRMIKVRFTIIADTIAGIVEYQEEHGTYTDKYGLFTLIIGKGTVLSNQSFSEIDWSKGKKFLKVELDVKNTGKYTLSTIQQMYSVPYALYAASSADGRSAGASRYRDSIMFENKINLMKDNFNTERQNDSIYFESKINTLDEKVSNIRISDSVMIFNKFNSLDTILSFSRFSDSVYLEKRFTSMDTLMQIYRSTDSVYVFQKFQNIDSIFIKTRTMDSLITDSKIRTVDSIQNYNRQRDSAYFEKRIGTNDSLLNMIMANDKDTSANNEIQVLSKNGNMIELSLDGGQVLDADTQKLTISNGGGVLYLSNGGQVVLNDSSSVNELQEITFANDTLTLSQGGSVRLPYRHKDTIEVHPDIFSPLSVSSTLILIPGSLNVTRTIDTVSVFTPGMMMTWEFDVDLNASISSNGSASVLLKLLDQNNNFIPCYVQVMGSSSHTARYVTSPTTIGGSGGGNYHITVKFVPEPGMSYTLQGDVSLYTQCCSSASADIGSPIILRTIVK